MKKIDPSSCGVPTQNQLVLAYLLLHGSITPDEAREHCGKVERLGARRYVLVHDWGWPIVNDPEEHGGDHPGHHARYVINWGDPARDLGLDLPEVRRCGFEYGRNPFAMGPYSLFLEYLKVRAKSPAPKTDRQRDLERMGQMDLRFMGFA